MNLELSEYILNHIGQPDYIDKWCGVVRTVAKEDKVFPVGNLLIGFECSRDNEVSEIIPDSKNIGILYFEDGGLTSTRNTSSALGYRSNLRIVCWLNGNKIKVAEDGHSLGGAAMADLMERLVNTSYPNNGIFINVRPTITGIIAQNAEVFGKYSYDDKNSGFLQGNFQYFAIDIAVNFFVSKRCTFTFQTITNLC